MTRNTSGRGGGSHKSGRHSHSSSGRTPRHGATHRTGHRASSAAASPLSGKLVDLDIDALALGGAGVGRMPERIDGVDEFTGAGMAVFVAGALPGSRVRARLTHVHRRHAEAVVAETLTPSPEAVEPFCPHFGLCGGCSLQHLAPESQLAWKQRQILEALARIGKVVPGTVLPPVAAPHSQRFRNKMEFAFQGKGDALRLGLYEASASGQATGVGRVFDLASCPIFPEVGEQIVHAVREGCKQARLLAYDRASHEGFLRHLVLRHSVHQDALLAQLITSPATEGQGRAVQALGQELLDRFPKLTGFVHSERGRSDGLAQAERTRLTLGAPVLIEALEDVRYSISADAFFQTCTKGAEALYAALRDLADLAPTDTVYDLYCGGGGISLFLAGSCGRVLGLEQNPSAIADAEANAKLGGIANCRFLRADLSGQEPIPLRLPEGYEQPAVAVVDPPREGLDFGLVQWLVHTPLPRLVYVSCNPATLARDAGLLAEAYELAAVRAVDLFPHTAHAECLALFIPKVLERP
ncbi:MAG: 23S rRNA (uracil(1939)-C(5))-methyltransferase RlmD [Humidesulfovibrio sp.]|uniref:23S rRNA (uracil(1939)-C(5))-methyltransferase RlmD n=1 Tax=Humidesulfovibrio sp. TaxID=2910988 RepID=UPI0027F596E5|nr:23S rRNA (uracil(1939)-C(5))-methyltransferase RlmD [Humidesulfovibrio sp.]MDQ7834972.1 23S rRNA (uracil(1939)-C(5))-methyltransferase RlmD [Humidesulfovibrio sp.]